MPERTSISAPRFDLSECRSGFEAAFVVSLHARAESEAWYADAWSRDDRLIISVDVSDREANCVLRTLRVDVFRDRIVVGSDSTHQLATDLDSSLPNLHEWSHELPEVLAGRVAEWLTSERSRPIERHEWHAKTFRHRKWVLADTGTVIVESDSQNMHRTDLGSPNRIVLVCGTPGPHR